MYSRNYCPCVWCTDSVKAGGTTNGVTIFPFFKNYLFNLIQPFRLCSGMPGQPPSQICQLPPQGQLGCSVQLSPRILWPSCLPGKEEEESGAAWLWAGGLWGSALGCAVGIQTAASAPWKPVLQNRDVGTAYPDVLLGSLEMRQDRKLLQGRTSGHCFLEYFECRIVNSHFSIPEKNWATKSCRNKYNAGSYKRKPQWEVSDTL